MTKFALSSKGAVQNRTPLERRKLVVSSVKPAGKGYATRREGKNGRVLDQARFSDRGNHALVVFVKSSIIDIREIFPRVMPISAAESQELSFHMLNSLDERMKEEQFDVFE
ncbi:hypothetical protein [Serratia aquatilis]|uniref:Uncharacterized protein n=1 Tax=Serratia aquatilis TaxID=1737515 RepID=A0ABV6EJI1_9GAMM